MSHTQQVETPGVSIAALSMVNVDCADPAALAQFWAAALGWTINYSDATYALVEGNGGKIGFGKIDGFKAAQWPDESGTKRFHLDLQVEDLESAAERLCAIGASRPDFQPGADRWVVLLDPDGQPFCLSPRPISPS